MGEPAAKRYPFRSPPNQAEALALGSVNLVSLANNHAQDYGPEALLQGIDLLHAAGVATVGGGANEWAAYAPHVADINGLRVAFLGYVHVPIEASTNFDTQSWTATADAPGLAWADPARIDADVGRHSLRGRPGRRLVSAGGYGCIRGAERGAGGRGPCRH